MVSYRVMSCRIVVVWILGSSSVARQVAGIHDKGVERERRGMNKT